MRYIISLVVSLYFLTLMFSFGEVQKTLEKTEVLIAESKFYEAMMALEPLLMTDQKSKDQEEALWYANMLCEELVSTLTTNYHNEQANTSSDSAPMKREKVKNLNRLGADIYYDGGELSSESYLYGYGYLKRFIENYPNSPRIPIAEYYLIRSEYFGWSGDTLTGDADEALKALHTYANKYAKNGFPEVYKAYLDIAHINHGRWAILTYPEEFFGPMDGLPSGEDLTRAAVCKANALKYYAKFIANKYYPDLKKSARKHYIDLIQNKKSGLFFIFVGC